MTTPPLERQYVEPDLAKGHYHAKDYQPVYLPVYLLMFIYYFDDWHEILESTEGQCMKYY